MKILLFIFLITTGKIYSQNDPWTEYMTPAAVHKQLANYTGEFRMDASMYMQEGSDPLKVTVNCKNTMRMGERFLHISQSGDMGGMPFEAVTMLGYNNSSQKLELSSFTNMGTGTVFLSGGWVEKGKIADLIGEMINPVNKAMIKIRQRITFVSQDEILIENFDQEGSGKEKLSMSYILKRKI